MSSQVVTGQTPAKPLDDPTPMPAHVPKVKELGVTSGPLKSAAFFIGAYCKDYNGASLFYLIVSGVQET